MYLLNHILTLKRLLLDLEFLFKVMTLASALPCSRSTMNAIFFHKSSCVTQAKCFTTVPSRNVSSFIAVNLIIFYFYSSYQKGTFIPLKGAY